MRLPSIFLHLWTAGNRLHERQDGQQAHIINTSLLPEGISQYHLHRVSTSGHVSIDFEAIYIASCSNSEHCFSYTEAIWLDVFTLLPSIKEKYEAHGNYCTVTGILDAENKGHMGLFAATIVVEEIECDAPDE